MRPTWRVPGAMALFLVLEWYGATSEVPWLFLLAAWMFAFVVGAAAYAWWNRSGLRLHLAAMASSSDLEDLPEQVLRTAPSAAVFERDTLEFEVGLDTNRGMQGPAWISGTIAGLSVSLGTGVVAKAGWRSRLELAEARRGPIRASSWTIRTSDPLGFFVGRRACPDSEVALVYPRFASLSRRHPVRELETAAAAPRTGSGNEVFGIREYRAGDSLRRIHWRSSARHGELVVREYEPPGLRTVTIVVDPRPPTREITDQVARIAASEAWDCIREGGRAAIGAIVSSDVWEILDWLARYPDVEVAEPTFARETVVVTADPALLDPAARRNWLIGDAESSSEIEFERVGVKWPL
ncbi:MAG TPA: DUF58 domain-containing protein [Candidatus Dormibacteraeota bacterium]|nr:DUF58 domain-containing protein [Candidatus Dormibacteraeota bacterium]